MSPLSKMSPYSMYRISVTRKDTERVESELLLNKSWCMARGVKQ